MALCASTAFYIPLELLSYAIDSLKATRQICDRITKSPHYNPELLDLGWVAVKIDGVGHSGALKGLPTRVDQRDLYDALLTERGEHCALGLLARRASIDQAFSRGMHLDELSPQSPSSHLAQDEFNYFAQSVFQRARLVRVVDDLVGEQR